ncbi:hypothetical protein BpHYR1_037807 [Brachionus plicatilis]|uniref:Uncharacterized protein n=1 Tax=Brachionus plicatilis TaxID=10195 RepID=A0A3M7PUS1_BRAPC|nr:hypothetical protein BpHYR1_037807 [Brachionus plicatilis]
MNALKAIQSLSSKTCSRNLFAQILQTSAEGETTVVSLCFIYRTILYEISQSLISNKAKQLRYHFAKNQTDPRNKFLVTKSIKNHIYLNPGFEFFEPQFTYKQKCGSTHGKVNTAGTKDHKQSSFRQLYDFNVLFYTILRLDKHIKNNKIQRQPHKGVDILTNLELRPRY